MRRIARIDNVQVLEEKMRYARSTRRILAGSNVDIALNLVCLKLLEPLCPFGSDQLLLLAI